MSTAAERDRRRRERRRAGFVVVQVEIHEDDVDALVERGRLNEWLDRDRDAIGAAVERLVRDYGHATRGQADPASMVSTSPELERG